jgi:hypothetical protein
MRQASRYDPGRVNVTENVSPVRQSRPDDRKP